MLDVLHERVQAVLGLELVLLGQPLLLELLLVDLSLAPEGLSQVVGHQLQGDQVLLHSLEHVLVGRFEQLLFFMLVLNFFQTHGVFDDLALVAAGELLYLALLLGDLLDALLDQLKFHLLLLGHAVDIVILDPQFLQSQ